MLTLAADHLWQSTLIAAAIAVVALALRRQPAQVRYALWLAASLKFLVPFAGLVALGGALSWRTVEVVPYAGDVVLIDTFTAPFSEPLLSVRPAQAGTRGMSAATIVPTLVLVWLTGSIALFVMWTVRWRRMRRQVRGATLVDSGRESDALRRVAATMGLAPVRLALADSTLEPGIFGILRPVLVWPRGISAHLTDRQIDAVMMHELCHLRRRDNLAAALHMAVQTICWFHPLVWWIGVRLVHERERACDEEVIRRGSEPDVYAESILTTCKFFLESPLPCVAGVTGADLKMRIEAIMQCEAAPEVRVWRTLLVAAAGVVAFVTPVAVGALNPPAQTRQVAAPGTLPAFEVISVRPNTSTGRAGRSGGQMQPGRFIVENATLRTVIRRAFGADGRAPGSGLDLFEAQVAGGPEWLDRDKFDIIATTAAPTTPPQMRLMVQRMLAERFKLVAHWESRELPVYVLRLARATQPGPGLRTVSADECTAARETGPMLPPEPGRPAPPPPCGAIQFGPGQLLARGAPMEFLATSLTNIPVVTGLDRMVLDRTSLEGNYAFTLRFAAAGAINPDPDRPDITTALREQLGLQLDATREPVEVLVIDSVEPPPPN